MKRTLKLLAKLYPASWRARYGNELDALIDDGTMRLADAFDVLRAGLRMHFTSRSFVRIVLPCALLGTLAGLAISIKRPALYQSQTLIQVDTNDRATMETKIAGLAQQAWTEQSLASIIQAENMYPAERLRIPMNEVVDLMRKHIYLLKPQSGDLLKLKKESGDDGSAFVLRFDYPDPHVAQRVDAELVSSFMGTNLHSRVKAANSAGNTVIVVQNPGTEQQTLHRFEDAGSGLHQTFSVFHAPSLPSKPMGPGRTTLAISGLFAGLLSGLALAAIFGTRSLSTIAKG